MPQKIQVIKKIKKGDMPTVRWFLDRGARGRVRFAPCVDGSPLARVFLMFCPSVGAAMCAACLCGTQRPLAIMPSAKTGPDQ